MNTIENNLHEYLKGKFLEAKAQDVEGDFTITITATGYLNSNNIKITSKVSMGSWESMAEMKSLSVEQAFPIAVQRAHENKRHEVKLLEAF